MFDELGDTIDSDTYFVNGESITISATAGTIYYVQIRQYENTSTYAITIK